MNSSGPWDLPLHGFEVLQITFAYPIDVVAYGDGGVDAIIRFEGPFRYLDSDGTAHDLDASKDSWEGLSVILALRHDRLQTVTADRAAELRVEFASGRRIEAGPVHMYENWQVTGPGFQLIAMPGGDVAVFGSELRRASG
jgi:hypothetical protein